MQIPHVIDIAQLFPVVCNDLYETSHYVREKGHTTEHQEDS